MYALQSRLLRFLILITITLLVSILSAKLFAPANAETRALASGNVCFGVDQKTVGARMINRLATIDLTTGEATLIRRTGTSQIASLAFQPYTNLLFAANGGQLGTLNLSTGAFTPSSQPIGSGSGSEGNVSFNSIKGISFDPMTDVLYGVARRSGDSQNDLLIQIDPTTGARVANAFGPNVEYVVITGAHENVDDIAIATSGIMYAASNLGNILGQDNLVTINKTTGAATVIGPFNVSPLEGMTLSMSGKLYGSTGKQGTTPDNLWTINKANGSTTLVGPFVNGFDYEGIACQLDLSTRTPTHTPTVTNTPGGPTSTPTHTLTPTVTNTPGGPTNTPSSTPTATTPTATPCSGKPGEVILLKPATGRTIKKQRARLDWNDVTCAVKYKVVVREGAPKGPRVFVKRGLTRSKIKTQILEPGKYYWRVIARNSIGVKRSDWWKFEFHPQ